ncbi:MAG: BolA family transcriptional regulator, partial [Rhodospirillales bacterium]|nr:BolA family transcriptional regulator [Rhodospirillales bacterium]
MTMQRTIESKISASLKPSHLEVINESHMHSVPPGS